MGGGNNSAQQASTAISQQQANTGQEFVNLAQQQLASSTALEQPLISFYQNILGNKPGALNTAISPQLGNIAQGAQQSEANIMNNVPAGAGRDAALAQARVQQGQQTAQTQNTAINSAYTGLAQLGAAQAGVGLSEAGAGLSGFSGAQQGYQTQEQAQAAEKSATLGAVGSIVGGVAGDFKFPCWIAEVLYGVDDIRTLTLRSYINGPFRQTIFGSVVRKIYIAIGRQVAWAARRSSALRWLLKPLFDKALARANAY